MKKIVSIVLVLVMALSLAACGASDDGSGAALQERKWKIGHVRPTETSTDDDVNAFAAELNKASEGNITLEVYPSSQLGNYTVVQERIGIGDIEMQLAPLGTSVDKSMGIASAPYLASNWSEAKTLFDMDGVLMTALAEKMEKQNLKLLAPYPKYFGGIALAKEPKNPGDPYESTGIKIRVPGIKSYEKTAQALGFIATPIAFSEAFTAIQTGIVDGAIGSGAEGYYSSFRDVVKYYLPVNDHFEMWFLYMSNDLWNKLSDKEKEVVLSSAKNLEDGRWDRAEAEEEDYLKKLADEGIVVYEFTDEELATFAKKVREEVWPVIKEDFGEELFNAVVDSIN